MSQPITHEIIVKNPYKVVKKLLENDYNNTCQKETTYEHISSELEIMLIINSPKETEVRVSFPNQNNYICTDDLKFSQLNLEKRQTAYFIQNHLYKINELLGKRLIDTTTFTLKWDNVTTWIYCLYPVFSMKLKHNLPGKDFLENDSRFNAKFEIDIYDKHLYKKVGVKDEEALFYKINIELKCIQKENNIDILETIYSHNHYNNICKIINCTYIGQIVDLLRNSTDNIENKDSILYMFTQQIYEILTKKIEMLFVD